MTIPNITNYAPYLLNGILQESTDAPFLEVSINFNNSGNIYNVGPSRSKGIWAIFGLYVYVDNITGPVQDTYQQIAFTFFTTEQSPSYGAGYIHKGTVSNGGFVNNASLAAGPHHNFSEHFNPPILYRSHRDFTFQWKVDNIVGMLSQVNNSAVKVGIHTIQVSTDT